MTVRTVLAKWLRQRADQLDPPRPLTHPVFYSHLFRPANGNTCGPAATGLVNFTINGQPWYGS